MKKKKIVALLLATSVIATSPALCTSPMMVFAEEAEGTSGEQIEVNTETIATNTSTIVTNEGTVETNAEEGTITTNEGSITTNEGTVDTNAEAGTITTNEGKITNNNGSVTTNEGVGMFSDYSSNIKENPSMLPEDATGDGITYNNSDVTTNDGDILINTGTVKNNNSYNNIYKNDSTVETNYGVIYDNYGTVDKNSNVKVEDVTTFGTIYNNYGTIDVNDGKILSSSGTINTNNKYADSNSGSIEINNGNIDINHGVVEENNGFITSNETDGTVEKNNTQITDNHGTVNENAKGETSWRDGGYIENNHNTVNVNNGWIWNNNGTILDNNGFVSENREDGTVIIDIESNVDENGTIIFDIENNGRVSSNNGIVEIIINEPATDDEIDEIVKTTVAKNHNQVDVKKSDEVIAKYYGISGYNGLTGDDYCQAYLDSVKENNTYTFSIPSGYGVDGNVILSKDSTTLEVIGDALETNEDGDYIVPIGTKFKVTGSATFLAKWYKILQSSGAIVEVVQDTSSNDDTPTQPTPVVKDFTTSVAGVEINSWEDVSTVMNTKADTIIAEPNSDFKLFKLELSKKQLTIPTSVVSNVATSQVDGLHCFIGDGDAITFIDNGTLGNYVPTDFTHSDKVTNDMKIISFEKPQAIGATVLLSTRVPAKNAPVAIWMLVDGKYELIGVDVSNATGNIAFPISSTGQFVLTY